MKQSTLKLLIKLSSNTRAQKNLIKYIDIGQYLIGIGSGGSTETSGEKIIIEQLLEVKNLNQPLTIFDVGANKGQFLNMIHQGLCGIPHIIHSFEPNPSTYDLLCENVKNMEGVITNNLGMGKIKGKFNLYFDKPGSGLASLSKRRLDHFGIDFSKTEEIQIDTLDNYCSNNNIDMIDLLKLDVEGHELDVLNGGKQIFETKKVRMVTFEFGGCNIDSKTFFQDFYYFFKENGMDKIFRITPSGYLFRISNYKEIDEQFRTTNYLVMREGD